jgi:hypothetical protein
MGKYLSLLKYEAKNIIRDPMNAYMCSFPVIILALSAFVFPMIFESIDPAKGAVLRVTMLLLIFIILAFGPFFLAAVATFLLLEHKDEHTLSTIAVTPAGTSGYIRFKLAYIYLMSVIGNIIVLAGTMILAGDRYSVMDFSLFDGIGPWHIISFSLVNGLLTPVLGLLQGAWAKNKVEGFAMIKGTGILALVPALMILETFQGKMQYLLGIFPNFWCIRGMLFEFMPVKTGSDLSFPAYLLIGTAYNLALLFFAYRYFLRKAEY